MGRKKAHVRRRRLEGAKGQEQEQEGRIGSKSKKEGKKGQEQEQEGRISSGESEKITKITSFL